MTAKFWFKSVAECEAEIDAHRLKPRIYFAGKIAKNDWRGNRTGATTPYSPDEADAQLFNPEFVVDCGSYIYGGPFFAACDHGCGHGPGTHGVNPEGMCFDYSFMRHRGDLSASTSDIRRKVFEVNQARIIKADFLFAFIESPDCYGTLFELGVAHRAGKPIYMAFPENATWVDDLWFCQQAARKIFFGPIETVWPAFLWTIKGAG